ncbi:hypothetical protein [Desulfogranum japonicum]|uniref:hypothetical protein n=1 Tax=Desulfogranum japonicum TaxID=231447 RepID=UPI0012946C9A|nr:hypothetical protein [Desulfogranum japonicum]
MNLGHARPNASTPGLTATVVLSDNRRERHKIDEMKRVTEKIHYPILLVSQLGNVVASMAQYRQYGTIDATTLPNRYPTQFLDIYYFPRP